MPTQEAICANGVYSGVPLALSALLCRSLTVERVPRPPVISCPRLTWSHSVSEEGERSLLRDTETAARAARHFSEIGILATSASHSRLRHLYLVRRDAYGTKRNDSIRVSQAGSDSWDTAPWLSTIKNTVKQERWARARKCTGTLGFSPLTRSTAPQL